MIKRVGIIGLGHVGEAVLNSLVKYSPLVYNRTSLKIKVKKVSDTNKSKKKIANKLALSFSSNPFDIINDPEIDIVIELIGGIEPARTFILEALKNGKSVITANKALLSSHGREIFSLAKSKNQSVGFEAAVCGAIPLVKNISESLVSCDVKKMYGILNGTTNYVLYRMARENIDFNAALSEAQAKGLAERKASLDIEGIDTLHKLCILSYLCYGVWPEFGKVYAEGISRISLLDIVYAKEMNYRIKLLAIAKKEKDLLDLRVHPTLVPAEHPLAQVSLAYNAVYLDSYPAGSLLFYGEGAGGVPTSASVISDIVRISSGNYGFMRKERRFNIKNIKDIKTRYYIRFMAHDVPGVLAKISKVLAFLNISIASVTQKERKKGRLVPIVMITHEASEGSVRKALVDIDRLKLIKSPSQIIRIENF